MDNFSDWLKHELEVRGWKQADLVRETNLDSAVISNLINGKRRAGETTARAIARALRFSPEYVFEIAGILPPKPELTPIKRKLIHLAEGLPDSDIEIAITILEQRHDYYKKNPSAKPAK